MTARPVVNPRRGTLLIVVALLAVAGVVAAVLSFQPRPEPRTVLAPPPTAALIVSVAQTGDRVVSLGFPTTLTVRALGDQPIASVELWVGARRLVEASNTGGGPAQVARWSWTPATAGPATVIARVTDARGREAQSAPLRLIVDPNPPSYRRIRPVMVEAGETALAAARRVGGDTAGLARWNEGLDPTAPLELGTAVNVPLDVRQVPRPAPIEEIRALTGSLPVLGGGTALGVGTIRLASWTGAGPEVTIGPSADGTGLFVPPQVTASVDGCTIKVDVSSAAANATGLAVYGLPPDSASFARVATFPAAGKGPSTFATTATAGSYLFSVSTYDSSVEEQGDLIAADVPATCGDPGWSGDARLSGGHLSVGEAVDRAYLYLSQDGGPWRRLPSDPQVFVDRIGGQLDFGPHLPAGFSSTTGDIEAWGWQGGSLVPLGTGHKDLPPSPGPSAPGLAGGGGGANLFAGGTFTELDWIAQKATGPTSEIPYKELLLRNGELAVWTKEGVVKADLTEDFRWLTNATGVDSLVWQVAAFPVPKDLAPDVPGVLLQKVLTVKDGTQGGEFPIDFRSLFAPPTQTAQVGDVLNGGLIQQLSFPEFQALASAPPTPVGPSGTATGSAVYSPSWLLSKFTPNVMYVRAIPMAGAKVVGGVSNFVKLAVIGDDFPTFEPGAFTPDPQPTPTPSSKPKPYQLFLQLLPPANANEEFADCVMVTGFEDWVKQSPTYDLKLEVGDFFCRVYSNSDGGWTLAGAFEDFVDFVADAWDAVIDAWNLLQAQLVSAIAKYSGCSAIAGGGFCEGLAKVAISVALASAGIPPSLPNTKELVAMGKGELKDVLVDLAGKAAQSVLGYDPCDAAYLASQSLGTDSCDKIAAQLLDDLVAQLDQLKTQEASAFTGVQIPPGVIAVPHPWGQLRPPRFRVTIARNTAVPLPTTGTCAMTLSMGSFVKDWTHKYYTPSTKAWGTITENVAGPPFVALTVSVPDPAKAETGYTELPTLLEPGASIWEVMFAALNKKQLITRDYYLTETNTWREPNNPGQIYVAGQGYVSFVDHGNRAWVLLQNGAGIIAKITRAPYAADCFDTVTAFGVIPPKNQGTIENQGTSCVPTYGWWSKTVDDPFAGTPAQKAACAWMYKQSTGY